MFSIIPASETASGFPPCVRPWGVKPEGERVHEWSRQGSLLAPPGSRRGSTGFTMTQPPVSAGLWAPLAAGGGAGTHPACSPMATVLSAGLIAGHLNLLGNYGLLPHYSGRTLGGRSSRRRASWAPSFHSVLGGLTRCTPAGWGASMSHGAPYLPLGGEG